MATWLAFALGATLCWALWAVLSKASGLPWREAAFWMQATQGVLALTLLLGGGPGWHGRATLMAVMAGVVNFLGVLLFYVALRVGPLGVVVPLTSLYPAVAVAIGVVFLRETVDLRQAAGITAAVIAVLLLARD